MENQYCKVGTVTPITNGRDTVTFLEYQYQSFMEKAANIQYSDTKLREFFEQKALKVKMMMENLI